MVASEVESSTCLLSSWTCWFKVETWRAESKDIFMIGHYCCFSESVASDKGQSPTERGYTVRFGLQLLHFVIQIHLDACMDKTKLHNETIWNVLLSNFCIFMNCLIFFFKLLFSGEYMNEVFDHWHHTQAPKWKANDRTFFFTKCNIRKGLISVILSFFYLVLFWVFFCVFHVCFMWVSDDLSVPPQWLNTVSLSGWAAAAGLGQEEKNSDTGLTFEDMFWFSGQRPPVSVQGTDP